MIDSEYDRFGPWVVEITEEDPPPPLFLPYLDKLDHSLFSVKIPRKIERRNARPGMNLYDYMVNLYEEEIEILERVEDEVRQHSFRYEDVQYIRFGEQLLKGTLYLRTPDQSFELPFNTVSKEIMQHVSCLIRERYANYPERMGNIREAANNVDKLGYYFSGLLERLKQSNPQLRILAIQPERFIGREERGLARRLFYGVVRKTLLETLHLSDGRELMIVNHGQNYKYGWQAIYGSSVYTLPLDRIRGTSWNLDSKSEAITHLQIYLSGSKVRFVLAEGNPAIPSYNAFLLGQR